MEATPKNDALTQQGDAIRLRLEVYEALAEAKGAGSVVKQAALHGVGRQHMFDLRAGRKLPSIRLAMRMAADLGTTVEALFERRAA